MPRREAISLGSGLPGRFHNSESFTSYVFTSLPLGGKPRERVPLSGRVSGEPLRVVFRELIWFDRIEFRKNDKIAEKHYIGIKVAV